MCMLCTLTYVTAPQKGRRLVSLCTIPLIFTHAGAPIAGILSAPRGLRSRAARADVAEEVLYKDACRIAKRFRRCVL